MSWLIFIFLEKRNNVEKNPAFKLLFNFIFFGFMLSSVINGGTQFGNNRMYL